MAQFSHLAACLSVVLDRNKRTANIPRQTHRGSCVYQGLHSSKILPQTKEELSHLHSTEIDSNSVAIVSHKSVFWCLKKPLQNPENHVKGEPYAGQPYARVCLTWLTIHEGTLFFPARSAQNGCITGRVCSNEIRLQCKLRCGALKGSG